MQERVSERFNCLRSMGARKLLLKLIRFGMIITSTLITWKALMCFTGSESPVVVVLSGSMEPGVKRGDILLLHMSQDSFRAGEIVVFSVDGRKIPIVHRIVKHKLLVKKLSQDAESIFQVLQHHGTQKGDNNQGDDKPLYAKGQHWLEPTYISGRAIGFLPYLGLLTIIMTERATFKCLLVSAFMLLSIICSE